MRRNVPVLARDGTLTGDALVALDVAETIVTLPGHDTVELWLRADVRHQEWPVGVHRYGLQVRDLRKAGVAATTLPVEVRVLDVDLGQATPMALNVWPELTHPRSWIVHGREEAALRNLFDYGVTVMTLTAKDLPWPEFNEDGSIASIDFAAHDQAVAFHRRGGSPLILYWMEMNAGRPENWALRSGFEPGSEVWKAAMTSWMAAWRDHLLGLGLTHDDFAFYVADEPNREELDRSLRVAEIGKGIDPRMQFYINHGGELWDDQAKNDRLLKVTDIWQPDEAHQSDRQRQILKPHDHLKVWFYQCLMARTEQGVNAHDYYRLMAWRAMRSGATGIGYWTYCATHPGEDPWDGTLGVASGGCLVYPDAADGLIMSARWELVRMALDDARYADLLRQATPSEQEQRSAIDSLLGERLTEIIAHPDRPELVVAWRIDAGELLETLSSASVAASTE